MKNRDIILNAWSYFTQCEKFITPDVIGIVDICRGKLSGRYLAQVGRLLTLFVCCKVSLLYLLCLVSYNPDICKIFSVRSFTSN